MIAVQSQRLPQRSLPHLSLLGALRYRRELFAPVQVTVILSPLRRRELRGWIVFRAVAVLGEIQTGRSHPEIVTVGSCRRRLRVPRLPHWSRVLTVEKRPYGYPRILAVRIPLSRHVLQLRPKPRKLGEHSVAEIIHLRRRKGRPRSFS